MKNVIAEYRGVQLREWLESIEYSLVRSIESQIPAHFIGTTRQVRGVMLAVDICLARDRKLYFVKDGVASPLSAEQVRQMGYTVSQLAACLAAARSSVRASRSRRHNDSPVLTTQVPVARK